MGRVFLGLVGVATLPRTLDPYTTSRDTTTYRRRNTIELCFNRLKGFRGIATRYEKTVASYEAAVALASFLSRPGYRRKACRHRALEAAA